MPSIGHKRRSSSFSASRNAKRSKKNPYTRRKRPSYKRKVATSTRRFNKQVLNVIKKTAEPKYIHWNLAQSGPATMKHNSLNGYVMYSVNSPLNVFPFVGDGPDQRNGNEIYAKGFMIRASFNMAGDRRGTSLRFYLVSPSNTTETPTYANLFQNITNNVELDPLDKTKFPHTKYLGMAKLPDRSAPTASIDGTFELIDSNIIWKKWIPFEKKIKFKQQSSNEPMNIAPYMTLCVTAYDHNSALETDVCVKDIDMMVSFYYSDP